MKDREKLALFTPDGKNKTFRVIPSGPKNASVFYTATMKIFQEEWNAGFDKTSVDPPKSSDNCPAKSKFDLITEWSIPVHSTSLLSFIILCTFYNCFSPWLEVNIKPLRIFQKKYYRKIIPLSLWTTELRELFHL